MNIHEILDDESYDPTDDMKPEYDIPAIRELARREGREYRGLADERGAKKILETSLNTRHSTQTLLVMDGVQ